MPEPTAVLPSQLRTYRVLKPAGDPAAHTATVWAGTEHTITIVRRDASDRSADELFVDHVHIDSANWKWRYPDADLVWGQGIGDEYRGGHLSLYGNHGAGTAAFGADAGSVHVQRIAAVYKCKVSSDAGATRDARTHALSWDEHSDAWKKATWTDAFLFGYYSFEYQINFAPAMATACGFIDTRGDKASWSPWIPPQDYRAANLFQPPFDPDLDSPGSPSNYTFAFQDLLLDFKLNDGVDTPTDPSTPSVFPYRMTVRFANQLCREYAGAMLVGGPNEQTGGKVLAVTGTAATSRDLVGHFVVRDRDGAVSSLFSVHEGNLIIDGEVAGSVNTEGTRLAWSGVSTALARRAGIPSDGHVELSPDGQRIASSSFGLTGGRVAVSALVEQHADLLAAQPALARAMADVEPGRLNVNGLLAMHNYELQKSGEGQAYVDVVQRPTMASFYKILESYMDKELRETYVRSGPVDLDPRERAIAESSATNAAFYKTMQVPYVANGLAMSMPTDEHAKHLNGARARKFLTSEPARHDEFTKQISLLYQYHWEQRFPQIRAYLEDQGKDHNADIDRIKNTWISQIQAGAESVVNPNDPKAGINKQISYVQELSEKAKSSNTYWAYMLYLYLVSNEALQAYAGQVNTPTQPNRTDSSQSLMLLLQTNNAVLNVLDPSGYFCGEYTRVLQLYNLSYVLTNWIDYGGNLSDFSVAAEEILRAYIDTYIKSLDPEMAARVKELRDQMTVQTLAEIRATILQAMSEANVQGSWADLMAIFDRKLASKGGTAFKWVAKAYAISMSIASIVLMAQGEKSWKDLTPETKARVIIGAVEGIAGVIALLVNRGVRIANRDLFFTAAANMSRTKQWLHLLFTDQTVTEANLAHINNGFTRWLARGHEASSIQAARTFARAGAAEDFTLTTKLFGRSLDEFVAVRLGVILAVANLIISAIQLAEDKDEYDKAVDGVLLAAAALDVIALAAEWSLAFIAAETVGATAVAAIAAIAGPLGMLASVVGVILFFVFMKTKNPLYRFLEDYAKPTYYMEVTAIDYFAIDRGSKGGTMLPAGLALHPVSLSWKEETGMRGDSPVTVHHYTINRDDSKALAVNANGAATVGTFAHAWGDVLSLDVDSGGLAQFFAVSPDRDKSKSRILGVPDATGAAALDLATDHGDSAKWIVEVIDADASGDADVPQVALVSLKNKATFVYLANDLSLVGSVGLPQQDSTKRWDGKSPAIWSLKRAAAKMDNASYSELVIFVDPTNTSSVAGNGASHLHVGQAGREPYTWTVNPKLPGHLKLDDKTGTVTFTGFADKTLTPQQMKDVAENAYTITIGSTLEDNSKYTTDVSLKVKVRDIRGPYEIVYADVTLSVGKDDHTTRTPGLTPFVSGNWSVDPALPEYLHLDSFTGQIKQLSAPPAPLAATKYTVTLKNDYGKGKGVVTIRVDAAKAIAEFA